MKKRFTLTQTSLLIFAALTLFTACSSNDNNESYRPSISIVPGRGAERIYLVGKGDNATLQLTKKQNYDCAYFQFGSVIGYDASNDLTPIFNPTTSVITTWDDDWDSDAVHSIANLKAGKGDPCRLVGYKASEVRTMLAANILPDNGKWRLPTMEENVAFAPEGERTGWNRVGKFNGLYFPTATSTSNWLPASGYRNFIGGAFNTVGISGSYWSSAVDGTDGFVLGFFPPYIPPFFPPDLSVLPPDGAMYVAPAFSTNRAKGLLVRCIRQ